MSQWARLITRIYRVLLAFYPPGFRTEFSQEMQDVFTTAFSKAQDRGWGSSWHLLWREIRDWPGSVLQAHLHARRSAMSLRSFFMSKPIAIWIVMNILGFGALGVLALAFPSFLSTSGMLATTIIISVPISLAQWIALRQLIPISIFWIPSMPTSLLLWVLILREIADRQGQIADDESVIVITALYLVLGILVGIPQWLILRHQFTRSSIWLLGTSLGVAAGVWLVSATDLINQSPILSYILAVIVYAIATGLILSRLFAKHQTNVVNAA